MPVDNLLPSNSQGILLVYDITNRWSFDGIDRWIKEIDEVSMDLCISGRDCGTKL
jgi:GTPase SAR1 family protein